MRLVQLLVAADDRARATDVLDREDVDYVLTADADRDAVVVEFPLPAGAVDYVVGELADAGVDADDYTVVVSAETARTEHFEALEDRFVEGSEEDDSVAREEIRSKARRMNPDPVAYAALTLLSAVVATAGLLLDSPAIVVGSMVIAPQVGSALATNVGVALNDRRMIRNGLRAQALSLAFAVACAAAFGWLLRTAAFVPQILDVTTVQQISKRISPGVLSLTVGLCAGAAGALSLATALPVSLVGVMVAAALIPAAATVGVGIAWNLPAVAFGAGVLLVVNTASVNLAGFSVLWALEYRPEDWTRGSLADNRPLRQFAPAAAALVVLLAVFLGAAVVMSEQIAFETAANREVEAVLDSPAYERLELVGVRTRFGGVPLVALDGRVVVVVSRPADHPYPDLSERIATRLDDATERPVSVEVQYVERQRGQPAGSRRSPSSSTRTRYPS